MRVVVQFKPTIKFSASDMKVTATYETTRDTGTEICGLLPGLQTQCTVEEVDSMWNYTKPEAQPSEAHQNGTCSQATQTSYKCIVQSLEDIHRIDVASV